MLLKNKSPKTYHQTKLIVNGLPKERIPKTTERLYPQGNVASAHKIHICYNGHELININRLNDNSISTVPIEISYYEFDGKNKMIKKYIPISCLWGKKAIEVYKHVTTVSHRTLISL